MQFVIGFFAICCTLASVVTSDHHYYRNREVILHNRPIVTQVHPHFQDDTRHLTHVNKFEDHIKHQYLVHIQGPVQASVKAKIEEVIGQKLGVYVPHNTFLLYATKDVAAKAISAPGVLWIGAVHPEDKYPAKMAELMSSNDATIDPKTLIISLVPEDRTFEEATFIAKHWAVRFPYKMDLKMMKADTKDKIILKLKSTAHFLKILQWVAERPESHWIEPGFIHISHNQYVTKVLQSNNVGVATTPFTALGINGTGQLIGLADSGLAYTSCYFNESITIQQNTLYLTNRKIVKYVTRFGDFLDADGHGTHVAGTIAGENQQSATENGVASAAKLHFTDISTQAGVLSPPTDVSQLFTEAYSDGARIFVASFGSTNSSWYTTNARDIDAYVAANPLLLVVVSAGNEGSAKSLSSLGVSKNALVVGASQSDPLGLGFPPTPVISGTHTLANFSSIGPAPDGRIKPDVVAPAQSITSASTETCGTTLRYGTSYAAGAAGAAAAIAKTWLTQGYYPAGVVDNVAFRDPATQVASLLKAILINSGQSLQYYDAGNGNILPLAKSFPGPEQGFGRIQLDKTLVLAGRSSTPSPNMIAVVETIANSGESFRFCFAANTSTPFVKVTLVWTDPAGSLSSGLALVNNLDLVVVESTGITHYTDTTEGKFDAVNNVEQITFTPTTATNFAVHVYGYNVPVGNQQFSVVVSGAESSTLCQLEFDPGQRVCPNQCSGRGTCNSNGFCQCNTGYKGADCSITPCPSDCSGNGVCDFDTSTCTCQNNFAPPSCAQLNPPVPPPQTPPPVTVGVPESGDGIDTGVFAGVVVAAFFVGAICSVVIGGFLAVKYLEYKRDQAHKDADTRGNADL